MRTEGKDFRGTTSVDAYYIDTLLNDAYNGGYRPRLLAHKGFGEEAPGG